MDDSPPIASPTEDTLRPLPLDPAHLARVRRAWPLAVAANLAVGFLSMSAQKVGTADIPESPDPQSLLLNLLSLALAIGVAFWVWKFASALRIKWAWLAAILSLFAVLGAGVIVTLNKLARVRLRAAGYSVSAFSARPPRLQREETSD